MSIQAVVFDLFHTLIDPEPLRPVGFDRAAAVASVSGLDRAAFERFWAATYSERETTTIDLIDLVQRHATSLGVVLDAEQRAALGAVFGAAEDSAMVQPDGRLIELVASLAEVAAVGVLSNCHEHEVRRWPDSPFAPLVTAIGRSSRIGVMKPDPGAYAWIMAALDAHPTRSIYVGNGGSDELLGARRSGFGVVIHCNAFDRTNLAIDLVEQGRRADQADESVDTIDALVETLERRAGIR